jgi:phospholipid/cholesterol/gamma-HCH transport system substrate-binding protein
MMTEIRKRAPDFAAILFLVVVAVLVGGYILKNQRLRFPFIEEKPMRVYAELSTAQAVIPGQGQTVRVAGVKVGAIGSVSLKDGRAVVGMDIDPQYKGGFVRENATALLRSKTGLKDMFIELDPGDDSAPAAKNGYTIPVNNTLPDVNTDEVLSTLDADTRDYLRLLLNGAGNGLDRRGSDLQEVFARFEPTYRDVSRLTSGLSRRRENLRHLIHSLQLLNTELASSGQDISELVDESAVVFRAFAAEQRGLRASLQLFPGSLKQTTTTLTKVDRFARVLGPTADRLRPAVRAITKANPAVTSLAVEATPHVRDEIRPFVVKARPLVHQLVEPVEDISDATPHLEQSFVRLNDLFNLIAFNPGGKEAPQSGEGINEGWLFWIAWVTHQTENLFSTQDANGSYRPVFVGGTCELFEAIAGIAPLPHIEVNPAAALLANFLGIINTACT